MSRKQYLPRTDCLFTEFIMNPPTPLEIMDKFNAMETELNEALGEIKGLRQLVNDCHVIAGQLETELTNSEKKVFAYKTALELSESELAEARAEIENKKEIMYEWLKEHAYKINHADKAIADRDKLIEQMREALELVIEGAIHDFHYVCQHRDNCLCWGCQKKRVKASLSAAERGDG